MIHAITHCLRLTRLRPPVLALLAALVGTSCDNSNPLASSDPSEPPTALATTDSLPTDSVSAFAAPEFASVSYSGIPFGPFGLWKSYTDVKWGPRPFTASHNSDNASGLVTRINAARLKGHRLVLALTGGPSTHYTTNGRFDLAKWKSKLNTYNTATIRNAVAGAVADGTIIGYSMIDEPETKRWGGVVSKPLLDKMATYAKGIFPTLRMGVNHGASAFYTWRTNERYHVVDYTLNSYGWRVNSGNAAAYRDKVLARARLEGITAAFALSILDGGIKKTNCFTSASACCPQPQTEGFGTLLGAGGYNCRMTAAQLRSWGQTLGVSGCALLLWTYDDKYMGRSDNQTAFRDVAAKLGSQPRRTCRRA
jgi:hypothetical protein